MSPMAPEAAELASVTRSGACRVILLVEAVIDGSEFRFESENRHHTLLSACPRCADCVDKVEIFGIRFFRNGEANSILQLKLAAAGPDTITQKNFARMTVPQLNF